MQNMLMLVDSVGYVRAFFDAEGDNIKNISLHDDKGIIPIADEHRLVHVRNLIRDYYLQSIAEAVIDRTNMKVMKLPVV